MDDEENDTEIERPPLVTIGSQFAMSIDALPPAFSTTIADGEEASPGAGEAGGSGSALAIATVEGVREESMRMRLKPRNV